MNLHFTYLNFKYKKILLFQLGKFFIDSVTAVCLLTKRLQILL